MNDEPTTEREHGRKNRRLGRVGGGVIAVAIALAIGYTAGEIIEANAWDPLGEYPVQVASPEPNTVHPSQDAGDPVPSIYWNQSVKVDAVKCAKDDAGTPRVRGDLTWQSDEPPGRSVFISRGTSTRGPGCVATTFINPIPDDVRDEMASMGDRESSEWHITGTEVPIDENGNEGRQRTWQTTTFRVIHQNAPAGSDG